MIENDLNAMLVATVTMGITAVMMAWCFVLVAVKEWAQRREEVTQGGKAWSESEFPVA
jgi:ABC-type Fe3+ transport system permease subunit